jgi:hypothetical protein
MTRKNRYGKDISVIHQEKNHMKLFFVHSFQAQGILPLGNVCCCPDPDTAHSVMDKKELVQRSNWQSRLSDMMTGQPV